MDWLTFLLDLNYNRITMRYNIPRPFTVGRQTGEISWKIIIKNCIKMYVIMLGTSECMLFILYAVTKDEHVLRWFLTKWLNTEVGQTRSWMTTFYVRSNLEWYCVCSTLVFIHFELFPRKGTDYLHKLWFSNLML